ncbi:MAG: XdhC family protein [Ardenticatenaceae bacterium]
MNEIYGQLARFVEMKTPVALATIVRVRGSVPREVGTKMIVHPLGQHVGTIGGGCGEGDVIRAGLLAIHSGQPQRLEVDLTDEITMESLGVCGGVMEVFVEPFLPQSGGE